MKNDGGPVFPRLVALRSMSRHVNAPNFDADVVGGMSLRDWFAGQVLTMLQDTAMVTWYYDKVAELAYKMADAMLREREK